jgi:hypothetical protein
MIFDFRRIGAVSHHVRITAASGCAGDRCLMRDQKGCSFNAYNIVIGRMSELGQNEPRQ